jgi:uncharacterized protein (DUF924 family)
MQPAAIAVLDFWFKELAPGQWFSGGAELDRIVRERFAGLLEEARRGAHDAWAGTPRGRLALILLLDQFSRHVFRGRAEAFDADAKAQRLSREGLDAGMDQRLTSAEKHFFYMPLMHAEDSELQALSVAKFKALKDEAASVLEFAEEHRSIVERFGRFPHRNETLQRASTEDERSFLEAGGTTFS